MVISSAELKKVLISCWSFLKAKGVLSRNQVVEATVIAEVSLPAKIINAALESIASLVNALFFSAFSLRIWDIISSRPDPWAIRESTFSRLQL